MPLRLDEDGRLINRRTDQIWIIYDSDTLEPLRHYYTPIACEKEFAELTTTGMKNLAHDTFNNWNPKWQTINTLRGTVA